MAVISRLHGGYIGSLAPQAAPAEGEGGKPASSAVANSAVVLLRGHSGPVYGASFSRDDQQLLTCSQAALRLEASTASLATLQQCLPCHARLHCPAAPAA